MSTKEQLDNAKEELTKPFEKEDELKTKVLRLAELNQMLDMGEVDETDRKTELLVDLKHAIIDYYNREFAENFHHDDFDTIYPDLKHVDIAYTTTEDEKHGILFELNLEDYTATQYVDEVPISHLHYLESNGDIETALEAIKMEVEYGAFAEFVSVDEDELKQATGLEVDDDGNFYDPLSKDMDNDGIIDRNDNDFRDSDAFESTYDVEDNLHIKEEKPSILSQISSFQAEAKEEVKESKEVLHEER